MRGLPEHIFRGNSCLGIYRILHSIPPIHLSYCNVSGDDIWHVVDVGQTEIVTNTSPL